MASDRDYMIVTNNPLAYSCMQGRYQFTYLPEASYREILVYVRDKVHIGHTLYTHPLSGSVKPNETPYKSIVISVEPHTFDLMEGEIISNAITVYDKFKPIGWQLEERHLKDFQLIDYTLLAGALNFDAEAGLSNINKR